MSVKRIASKLKDLFLDLMFPPRCINCGCAGDYICEVCRSMLHSIDGSLCQYCGMSMAPGMLCIACMEDIRYIDGIYSLYKFDGVARRAIHQLKYNNLRVLSGLMAEYLYAYTLQNKVLCDVIVPVPLHSSRLRERGYNQSLLLCRKLGRLSGMPVDSKSLIRSRRTVSQTECDRNGRMLNVKEAFRCNGGIPNGASVLLIDDVCTTGATLESCAQALKNGGVSTVYGLTFARDF